MRLLLGGNKWFAPAHVHDPAQFIAARQTNHCRADEGVSEAITRSALERKESRGAQFRDDYPNKDAAFGKVNIVVRRQPDGTMALRREPIPEMRAELKQIIDEMK